MFLNGCGYGCGLKPRPLPCLYLLLQIVLQSHCQLSQLVPLLIQTNRSVLGMSDGNIETFVELEYK